MMTTLGTDSCPFTYVDRFLFQDNNFQNDDLRQSFRNFPESSNQKLFCHEQTASQSYDVIKINFKIIEICKEDE